MSLLEKKTLKERIEFLEKRCSNMPSYEYLAKRIDSMEWLIVKEIFTLKQKISELQKKIDSNETPDANELKEIQERLDEIEKQTLNSE